MMYAPEPNTHNQKKKEGTQLERGLNSICVCAVLAGGFLSLCGAGFSVRHTHLCGGGAAAEALR